MNLNTRAPRSPRVRLGGFAHLPRLLDKARGVIAGTPGEYHYNCPLDKLFFSFTGIDSEAMLAEIRTGKSDTEMLAWVRSRLPANIGDSAIEQWTASMNLRAPGSADGHAWFAEMIQKLAPERDDIRTFFDLLDLDDHVSYGGKG